MNAKEAGKLDVAGAPAEPKLVRAIHPARVKNMAQACGEPHQIVLEDGLDPFEVLKNRAYFQALDIRLFSAGARIEVTNDSGSYLLEAWVRRVHGTAASGLKDISFFVRVVFDERGEADLAPIESTGRWEVMWRGRHKLWRVYRPNGTEVDTPFNDETSAVAYARQQEGNPKAR